MVIDTLRRVLMLCIIAGVAEATPAFADGPQTTDRPGQTKSQVDFEIAVTAAKQAMLADPAKAAEEARRAEDIATSAHAMRSPERALATALWLQAEAALRLNQTQDVDALLERAITFASRDGSNNKLDGDLQLTRARFAAAKGRVDVALESYHQAHDIFSELGEQRSQSMALQGLGSIYSEARDFDKVLEYYARASAIYSGDPALDLPAANNLANAYRELGKFQEALKQFKIALKATEKLGSPLLRARVLTNIARVHIALGNLSEAESEAERALRLLDVSGEANWAVFVWGVISELELKRGDIEQAVAAIEKTFDGTDIDSTPPPFRDMHEIAYRTYLAAGNLELALRHHIAFKRLDDNGRALTASINLALITGKFDLTTKQLEIAELTRGQLERDLALEEARRQEQRLLFLGLFVLSIGASAWIAWGYVSMRRHRNEINSANERLRDLIEELNEEIGLRKETEIELRAAKEEAESASHAKTQFLANMSHELRTPLNAIIGFAEIIEGEIMGAVGTPAYKGYATDIRESGYHLLSIVSDILDMAKIDSGRMPLKEDEFDIGDAISRTVSSLTHLASRNGTKLKFESSNEEVVVLADERFIHQILTNLITNAVKFTDDDGEVTVTLSHAEGGGLDIRVIDNGIGIDPAKIDKIMEPFGQVEDSYARSFGGVGLGLPIVRSLVELHGGSLKIKSLPGEGTTAVVHLPPERIVQSPRARNIALVQ